MAWIAPLSAILAALLTAVVGNRLIHVWQQRSWRHQQQFQGLEKEYYSLKLLNENITKDCGDRLSIMRELQSALGRGQFSAELSAYKSVVRSWNKSINAYFSQLTFQLKWRYATELEHYIHEPFVKVGILLEEEIRSQNASNLPSRSRLAKADKELNKIAGQIAHFSRALTRKTEERRQEVFYGTKFEYTESDIIRFSNIELIKLLFESNIDEFSVIRPSSHIAAPLGRGL